MDIKTKEIYSEVYQVLNLSENDYLNKLPDSLINMLREKRDVNYNPQYTADIPLNEQNIKKETIFIIVLLYLNYWCKDEKEVLEVKKILKENEDKYQVEFREKYNPDNIFKNNIRETKENTQNVINETTMILYKKSVFIKIINRLKNFFFFF